METIHTIGRRKASVARIYMAKGKGNITVNGKDFKEYFPVDTMQFKLEQPFKISDLSGKFDVKVNVDGGGTTGQAEAIRLGCARALCLMDQTYRTELKANGFLTRNSLKKERKKYGLKKARKAPQFSKR